MTSPLEKGNALESAVRAIESAILESSPALRENKFKIESKKHVNVDGVRHEVDVYVEVDLGKGYKSTFIFECKNWQDAVGKNEIIIFSEKIDAVQAQGGFFVAKSTTKDAKAQAEKDRRITLLTATEHNVGETPAPFDFNIISVERRDAEIDFVPRDKLALQQREPVQLSEARAMQKGADLNLEQYVHEWISETCDENLRTFPSATLGEGDYEREAEARRVFDEGELTVNDLDIAEAKLRIKLSVRVSRPPVVSHFEVATRGRSLSFAPVTLGIGTLQARYVENDI